MNRNTDISPEEFERIERYLLKQMPDDEYEAFAKQHRNDPTLAGKIHSVTLMLVGIQENTLLERIDAFHQNLSVLKERTNHPSGKVFRMKRWLVAGSLIVLAGLAALLFLNKSHKSDRLFFAYYKPDRGLITAMGTSDNYLFDRAMIDYKTKRYDSAVKAWERLLGSNPSNDTLNYFIGSAFLANNNIDSAVYYFEKVSNNQKSAFLNDAYWYLGLASLKQQKSRNAILYIEKSNHPKKEEILRKLKK